MKVVITKGMFKNAKKVFIQLKFDRPTLFIVVIGIDLHLKLYLVDCVRYLKNCDSNNSVWSVFSLINIKFALPLPAMKRNAISWQTAYFIRVYDIQMSNMTVNEKTNDDSY